MPPKKKLRLEEPLQLIGFPDEIIVHTLSFLNPLGVWQCGCVCTRLSEIATNCLREAAEKADPLSAEIFKSIHDEKKNKANNSVASLRPVALWKNLLVSCEKRAQHVDYHSVCDGGIPYVHELPPDDEWTPNGIPASAGYRFAVRLWVKDWGNGKLSASTVRVFFLYSTTDILLFFSNPMQREQAGQALDVSHRLKSGDYYALEILLSSVTNAAATDTKWVPVYSSLLPLQPYGGGSFEEYEAMPWYMGDIDERLHEGARKWAWLPFSKVEIDTTSDQAKIHLQFQWLARRGQSQSYEESGPLLKGYNRFNFLKHRCNQTTSNNNANSKLPHCLRNSTPDLENFVPKPLEAYSFRIDIQKDSDPSEKQSIFFEELPNEQLEDGDFPQLSFEIPKEYHDCFPWAEDYTDRGGGVPLVEFDEKFSIYAIDRHTGKQAKVFESGACEIWEYFSVHPFLGFEKSAALSQYNFGSEVSTIPVPATDVMMHEAWKEDDFITGESPPSSRTLGLHFKFQYYSGQSPGTGAAIKNVDGLDKDILTFLEKGLAYK